MVSNVNSMPHANDPVKMKEHMVLMDLVPESAVTHKAVKNGAWFDESTWEKGKVPDDNANVMVESGVTVTYGDESDVQLKTVRVDGTLTFATNKDTKMVVDTFVNAPSGTLNIGSQNNPVQAAFAAKILIAGKGNIDTKWDPTQLSRGVISHGQVNIYGADKTDFIALQQDAKAGDRELILSGPPKGWLVGDKLVLGGTEYNRSGNDANNSRFGDEELTITEIAGNRVRFTNDDVKSGDNSALRFDHTRPDIPEKAKIKLYVANTTRNVSIETQNADGLPIQQRGHVMFMHSPDVRVNNAGFYNLGRSDKSKLVDDPGKNIDGSNGRGGNPRGRYGVHFHRTGADDVKGQAAIATGNAVVGSPGWGMVQHDSNAILEDNVVYDVVGTGIAAESGNELGRWRNNLTMKITGPGQRLTSQQVETRKKKFDLGFEGEGYWVQGAAQVAMEDNIAISTNGAGITLFGDTQGNEARDAKTILIKNLTSRIQALFPAGQTEVDITDVPLNQLTGFQSYNADVGINVWSQLANFDGQLELNNRTPNASHAGRATIDNFTVWNNRTKGINTDYSGSIDFVDGLIVGDVEDPGGDGIVHNHATHRNRYDRLTVRGFGEGFQIEFPDIDKSQLASTLENSVFGNNTYNLEKIGDKEGGDLDDFPAFLKIKNTSFQTVNGNKAPVPKFTSKAAGGRSVTFDASSSYDPDPLRYAPPGKGIATYAWDFDKDGKIDQFGREVTHHFSSSGSHNVSLQVLDNQGASTKMTQTIQVSPTAYQNPIVQGDIGSNVQLSKERRLSSLSADQGWQIAAGARRSGDTVMLSNNGARRSAIGQVVKNDGLHQGKQTVGFRLKNTEGSNRARDNNEVKVQLWGVNGQFDGHLTEGDGPTQAGTIPMSKTKLLERNFGGASGQFFDWKVFNETVDLGGGYEYLVAHVKSENSDDGGDVVALDYFVLKDDLSGGGKSSSSTSDSEMVSEMITSAVEPLTTPPSTEIYPEVPSLPKSALSTQTDLHKLPNLIAKFSLNEITGKSAADSSVLGANHTGALKGTAVWSEGLQAGGVSFQGDGTGGSVDISDSKDLNMTAQGERTVSLWFKADELSDGKKQVLYEEGAGSRGLNAYLDGDELLVGGWNRPATESSWSGTWLDTDQVSADTWHHVALVLEGGEGVTPDAFRGYLDGKEFGAGEGSQLWEHGGKVSLGGMSGGTRFREGLVSGRGQGLTGSIDEVAIFNGALDASQVQSLATSDFGQGVL